jgi:hypothetical protein
MVRERLCGSVLTVFLRENILYLRLVHDRISVFRRRSVPIVVLLRRHWSRVKLSTSPSMDEALGIF